MANITHLKSDKDLRLSQAIDELSILQSCFAAVADLMIPDYHLQERERDHVAMLMDYLTRRHGVVLDKVRGVSRHE